MQAFTQVLFHIKPEIKKRVDIYCAQKGLKKREFFEQSILEKLKKENAE